MMQPTYRNLKKATHLWHPSVLFCSGSPGPQGNPRFYKHYWRVFSLHCPWEDEEFFRYAPVLCNTDCEKEVQRLLAQGQSCMIYGFRRPRADPSNPFDRQAEKWANTEFAPSWDDDADPPLDGHK